MGFQYFHEAFCLFQCHRRVDGERKDGLCNTFCLMVLITTVVDIVRIHRGGADDAAGPAIIKVDIFSFEEGAGERGVKKHRKLLQRQILSDAVEHFPFPILASLEIEFRERATMVIHLRELLQLRECEGGAGVGDCMEGLIHGPFLLLLGHNGNEEAEAARNPQEKLADAEAIERAGDGVEEGIEEKAENVGFWLLRQAAFVCPIISSLIGRGLR